MDSEKKMGKAFGTWGAGFLVVFAFGEYHLKEI